MQKCNHCDSVFDESLKECPFCGADDALMYPIEEKSMMVCIECGADNWMSEDRCPACDGQVFVVTKTQKEKEEAVDMLTIDEPKKTHTPAPWRVATKDDNKYVGTVHPVCGDYNGIITNGYPLNGFSITGYMSKEDVTLMAEAPELLKVCEDLIAQINGMNNARAFDIVEAMRVIAKAKGE